MTERARLVEVHIALSMLDPKMLTSPDGKRIEVDISAVVELLAMERRGIGGEPANSSTIPAPVSPFTRERS